MSDTDGDLGRLIERESQRRREEAERTEEAETLAPPSSPEPALLGQPPPVDEARLRGSLKALLEQYDELLEANAGRPIRSLPHKTATAWIELIRATGGSPQAELRIASASLALILAIYSGGPNQTAHLSRAAVALHQLAASLPPAPE